MRNFIFRCLLTVCGIAAAAEAAAQDSTVNADRVRACQNTTECSSHRFKPTLLIAPAALIAVGAFGVENGAMHELNREVHDAMGGGTHSRNRIDEVMPYLPAMAVYSLDLCGVKAKHHWKDRTLLLAMSFVITQGMSKGTKMLVNEWRPDGSNCHSFPSGHTASAFMSAEFLRLEYRDASPWIAVGGYTVAAATGAMRIYNNRHWLNDIIAGAGIGILGTRIAYWIYPWVQRHLTIKSTDKKAAALLLPYTSTTDTGMMLAVSF